MLTKKETEVDIHVIGEVTTEYALKIRYLLVRYELFDEDGVFIFPDGDTWER